MEKFRITSYNVCYTKLLRCPVCAYPAMHHGTSFEKFPAFSYTMTYNLTGWPAAVVRAGTSPEGLPIGVQVVARNNFV